MPIENKPHRASPSALAHLDGLLDEALEQTFPASDAASSGRFALNREIPVCAGLRGGAERTRTWNQTPCTPNMEKGLDFGRKRSVSVAAIYGPLGPTWIAPRRRCRHRGASVVTALDAVATERIPNVAEQTLRES